MKTLIANILLFLALTARADTVSFKWRANPESNITGYILNVGPTFANSVAFDIPPTQTRVTVVMAPHQFAWLRARNSAGLDSLPAGPLEYRPVAAELILQVTKDFFWLEYERWELFRMPDVIFDYSRLNITQRLEMIPDRVAVRTSVGEFKSTVNTSEPGQKFFRSYVAARPL